MLITASNITKNSALFDEVYVKYSNCWPLIYLEMLLKRTESLERIHLKLCFWFEQQVATLEIKVSLLHFIHEAVWFSLYSYFCGFSRQELIIKTVSLLIQSLLHLCLVTVLFRLAATGGRGAVVPPNFRVEGRCVSV